MLSIGYLGYFIGLEIFILGNIWFYVVLVSLVLLVLGWEIIIDGVCSLLCNVLNMNILVGLGVVIVYIISIVVLLVFELGWECFFDEFVMIFGFIFLGKILE